MNNKTREKEVNFFETVRVVRFGARDIKEENKNKSFNNIAKCFKSNEIIKDKIENLLKRSVWSFDQGRWSGFVKKLDVRIKPIKDFLEIIHFSIENLRNIEGKNQHKVLLDLKKLKSIGGFGKGLYYKFEKTETETLFKLVGEKNVDDLKKYFSAHQEEFDKFVCVLDLIMLFVDKKSEEAQVKLEKIIKDIKCDNHDRQRLNSLYSDIEILKRDIDNVYVFLSAFSFSSCLTEDVKQFKKLLDSLEEKCDVVAIILEELLGDFRDPNNGYEVGRATLHYRTLNKQGNVDNEIEKYKKLLGRETNNRLSLIGKEIVNKLKDEDGNIKNKEALLEKIDYVLKKCQELTVKNGVSEEITLWDVCNCLNNKNQTYHEFIENKQSFDDLGMKQRLRFALTVLVDCDIYKPVKFLKRCEEIRGEAEKVLKDFGFKKYDEYKELTQKINNKQDVRKYAIERGNLYCGSDLYRYLVQVNKAIPALRGSLTQFIKRLEDDKESLNLLQYYAILGSSLKGHAIIFIPKERAGELKEYCGKKENRSGNDSMFFYTSLTWKSLKKLFDQPYSDQHPFKSIKKEIFNKNKQNGLGEKKLEHMEIDKLKLADLKIDDIKALFKSDDIPEHEAWQKKFEKLYKSIEDWGDLKTAKESIEKNGIFFVKSPINFEKILEKFPDVIIANLNNGFNGHKSTLHEEYFNHAILEMENLKNAECKLNPEILITYKPEALDFDKKEKKSEKKYTNPSQRLSGNFLEENHRYWREQITLSFGVEFELPPSQTEHFDKYRVLGIDRGEKKIATICHLEYDGAVGASGYFKKIKLLPIEYWEMKDDGWVKKETYFLDAANYKIGLYKNGELNNRGIIRIVNDNNLHLKRYEYLTRLQKTLWLQKRQDQLKEVCVGELIASEEIIKKIELKGGILNVCGLGTYRDSLFKDDIFKKQVFEIVNNWLVFDKSKIPVERIQQKEWYQKKIDLEVNSVLLRDNISANIAGIINFLYSKNYNEGIKTFTGLENLHNVGYNSLTTIDPVTGNKLVNEDFIESRHRKIANVSVYGKIQWGIINKLQVQRADVKKYSNFSHNSNGLSYKQKIKAELKFISSSENKKDIEDFYGEVYKISPAKKYGSVVFVDPWYTSKKCPNCGKYGKSGIKRDGKDDKISCKFCKFPGSECNRNGFQSAGYIKTGDENGSFQIGLRAIQCLLGKYIKE